MPLSALVAAAGRGEVLRRADDLRAGFGQLGVKRIDIGAAGRSQRDHVDALGLGCAQPHDMMLMSAVIDQPTTRRENRSMTAAT